MGVIAGKVVQAVLILVVLPSFDLELKQDGLGIRSRSSLCLCVQ